jgi:transposase
MNHSRKIVAVSSNDCCALVAFDVAKDSLSYRSQMLDILVTEEISNTFDVALSTLEGLRQRATESGFADIHIVLEPTGPYHKPLVAAAKKLGVSKEWIKTEVLAKLRFVESGDDGKSDVKDPCVLELAAALGKTMILRDLDKPYSLLREWGAIYDTAERGLIAAKCRIHPLLKQLLPEFDFGSDFLYGPSGTAFIQRFGANPFKVTRRGIKTFKTRMKRAAPRMQARSMERLYEHARASIRSGLDEDLADVLEIRLRQAWEDLTTSLARRQEAAAKLEELYDQARQSDPRLPQPTQGVITKLQGGRLIAESGPLSDFRTGDQLLRYLSLNLIGNDSGKQRGRVRTSKKGRRRGSKVAHQVAFALSKKDRLFGEFYHGKKERMGGTKAMTATARKWLLMIFGWYRSGREFNLNRVFQSESQCLAKAA